MEAREARAIRSTDGQRRGPASAMLNHVPHDVLREDRPDGSVLLRSRIPLGPVARSVGDWLDVWAVKAPGRVFVAERSGDGWRELRYAELHGQVRAVAASLLARGLDERTPVLVISGNGVDHAVLALAAQYVGIPVVPVAEQYALVPDAHARLRQVVEVVRPALVFAEDSATYGAALSLHGLDDAEKVVARPGPGGPATLFSELLKGDAGVDVEAAHARVGPETLAKIIFTSGSTGAPKGVLTTHGMLCVNQAQMTAVNPVFSARPPKILDWLPWNHVFGGSHNFNIVLANGGSLYIDDGKPTKAGFGATLRNVLEHPGNLSFNVPIGYAQIVAAARRDPDLKRSFFGDLDLIFYAAASVPQEVWDALAGLARDVTGQVPLMLAGWGMSETSPAALQSHEPVGRPGNIGVPLPAVTAKLMPGEDGRYELRVSGPNVMSGYHGEAARTAESFDAEGFLITGDAVKLIDPTTPNAGLSFDGRIAEDFKLMSGTWVRATLVRLDALKHFADLAQDIVITGHDRVELGVLIFPDQAFLRTRCPDAVEDAGAYRGDSLGEILTARLATAARGATGSSTRIARALVAASPPSMSDGELTAKGSINARRVLAFRQALVDRLYDDDDPAVIGLREG